MKKKKSIGKPATGNSEPEVDGAMSDTRLWVLCMMRKSGTS